MMQEVLTKPGNDALPVAAQEFYELTIEEARDARGLWFLVRKTRAVWSEVDQRFLFGKPETQPWLTLERAQEDYAAKLKALHSMGYTHSDMDFF